MATNPEPTKPASTLSSPLAVAGLAIALYIAVIDAAVETFLSGSPVRWWVAGAVAVYLAASVALWRYRRSVWQSIGWSARASASFFLLLGLLAFTVWLPGGLDDGLRLAGAQTSTVLSLLTAIVVALAGVSLVQRSWPNRWVKWVIGALAAYGVVGFVKGIISGTSYPELIRGQSFWSWLPWWLQGAFVGALVIVPLGLVARAARMLKATPGATRNWELRQLVAMAMSVLMAASAFTGTGAFGPQPSAAEIVQPLSKSEQDLGEALAGPTPKTPPTPDQVADKLEKVFPLLEKAEREISRDTFDLQAVIDKVGKDPQKLFEWVRDNTYFVPYRGLLRGDKGVLMDRLGNSLDRAMLLYAMVRNIGQPVRLAHGALTEDQAQDVLSKVRPFPSFEERTGSASSAADADAFVKQYADQNHVDAAKIRKALDQLTAQQQRVKELVQTRVASQAAMIAAAVGRPPANALAQERAEQVRAVTDHWWVQWQSGSNWLDLDPTLPDAQPGKTLTARQATATPTNYSDLGDNLLHTVQIKVMIEVWKHGSVTEVPVLTQKLLPADLIGEPIVLRQIPVAWPRDLNLFQEENPLERFKQTVLGQTEWLPVLSVGSKNVSKYSFNDYGDLTDSRVLAHKEEEGVEGLGKSIGGMLGGSVAHQPSPAEKAPIQPQRTQVTAEWIDYQIQSPGHQPETIRRELFDVLPGSARTAVTISVPPLTQETVLNRNLAILGETHILGLGSQISGSFVQHLIAQNLRGNRDVISKLLRSTRLADLNQSLNDLKLFPWMLYELALSRWQWSRQTVHLYVNIPNVLTYHEYLTAGKAGEVSLNQGFDIVANDVALAPAGANRSFLTRMEQGVLDTNAEAFVAVAPSQRNNPLWVGGHMSGNAGELFSASKNTEWLALRDTATAEWRAIHLPAGIQDRLEREIHRGLVIVAPREPIHIDGRDTVAWWAIDPKTGRTLGLGDRGWGQATEAELTAKENEAMLVVMIKVVFALSVLIACSKKSGNQTQSKQAACAGAMTISLVSAGLPGVWAALVSGGASLGGQFVP